MPMDEPPVGTTVEIGETSLQAGWCYHRVDEGWVRVFSSGALDRGHSLRWSRLVSHEPTVVDRPSYCDDGWQP